MGEFYIIAYLMMYLIESYIWIRVFSNLYPKKKQQKYYYILAFVLIYVVVVIKQLFLVNNDIFNSIYIPFYIMLLVFLLQFLYECTLAEKIFCIGTLLLFSMIIDLISLGICSLILGYTISELQGCGKENIICTAIGRIITVMLYCGLFVKGRLKLSEKNVTLKDVGITIFPNLFICMSYYVLVNNLNELDDNVGVVFFLIIVNIICFSCSVLYLLRMANLRRKIEYEYKIYIKQTKHQYHLYEEMDRMMRIIKEMQKQTVASYGMIEILLHESNYNRLESYLEEEIEKIQDNKHDDGKILYSNRKIAILLTMMKKVSKCENIAFSTSLRIASLGIPDYDSCCLIACLLQNAIVSTAGDIIKEKFVRITIDNEAEGFYILCENAMKKQPVIRENTYMIIRNENGTEGLSLRLIYNITEKYGGHLKFGYAKETFTTYVFIKYVQKNEKILY